MFNCENVYQNMNPFIIYDNVNLNLSMSNDKKFKCVYFQCAHNS